MKLRDSVLNMVVILAALPVSVFSQETSPAQPLAEAQVARVFKAAAPDLFRAWLQDRPEQLKHLSLGRLAEATCKSSTVGGTVQYIAFLECQDSVLPSDYRIDVKKTDSVLTPFMGLMLVPVKMTCTLKDAFPKAWNAEKKATLIAACVGTLYDQCLTAGVKPMGSMVKVMCGAPELMGLGTPFSYEGEEHATYHWTEGKWEFQDQHEEPPLHPTGAAVSKAAG